MYKVGQEIHIGLYSGFRNQMLFKTKATVTKIYGKWIHIKVDLRYGSYKTMLGTEKYLQQLEENFRKAL